MMLHKLEESYMISFVWSAKWPFLSGAGGSESYTAGHIRELKKRGIAARIITIGHGENDGRDCYPDISFTAISSPSELETLDDTLVFITYPLPVKTKHQSYVILHCPPFSCGRPDPLFNKAGIKGKQLIATSKFAARMWSHDLKRTLTRIPVVYPFAAESFAEAKRPARVKDGKVRLFFGGRCTPDKGIYTLLAALHMSRMNQIDVEVTCTTAGSHTEEGQVIRAMLEANPWIKLVRPAQTPQEMAELLSRQDIVVMPSTDIFWKEIFGMISVEAQHAGCRVVASRSGGLPETNCGGLLLVRPDNPMSLANGIVKAAGLGPLTAAERALATQKFTVKQSVDRLLRIIQPKEGLDSLLQLEKRPLIRQQLKLASQRFGEFGLRLTGENEAFYGNPRLTRR
jgi:D-inositol-3-phosphate glycosyltransferase